MEPTATMHDFDYDPAAMERQELVNGHYELGPVQTLEIAGRRIAYRMGSAALDNSCCGAYGCAYALVLGEDAASPATGAAITNASANPSAVLRLHEIAPESPLAAEIKRELAAREQISMVNFYLQPHRATPA